MAVIGIRKLSNETSKVIKEFEETGEPVIITRQGQPIGALVSVDRERLDDIILSTAPDFHASVERADADFEEGRTRSLADYARERSIELPERGADAEGDRKEEEGSLSEGSEAVLLKRMRAATEQELHSLTSVLSEPFALRVVNDASADVGTLSRETLVALGEDASAETTPDQELNELAEATAGFYSWVLMRNLVHSLADEDPDEALAASRLRARSVLRRWNQSLVVGSAERSVHGYLTSMRAVRAGLGIAEEAASSERAVTADVLFPGESVISP